MESKDHEAKRPKIDHTLRVPSQALARLIDRHCSPQQKLLKVQELSLHWNSAVNQPDSWTVIRKVYVKGNEDKSNSVLRLPNFLAPDQHQDQHYKKNANSEMMQSVKRVLQLCKRIDTFDIFNSESDHIYLPFEMRSALLHVLPKCTQLKLVSVDVNEEVLEMIDAFWLPLLQSLRNRSRLMAKPKPRFIITMNDGHSDLLLNTLRDFLCSGFTFESIQLWSLSSANLTQEQRTSILSAAEGVQTERLLFTPEAHGHFNSFIVDFINQLTPGCIKELGWEGGFTEDDDGGTFLSFLNGVKASQLSAITYYDQQVNLQPDDLPDIGHYKSIQSTIYYLRLILEKMPNLQKLHFVPVESLQTQFESELEHLDALIGVLMSMGGGDKQSCERTVTLGNCVDTRWIKENVGDVMDILNKRFPIENYGVQSSFLACDDGPDGSVRFQYKLHVRHFESDCSLKIWFIADYDDVVVAEGEGEGDA